MGTEETDDGENGIYTKNTLILFFVLTIATTTAAASWYAPAEWSVFKIGAAGFIGGALSFVMIFINHLIIFPAKNQNDP